MRATAYLDQNPGAVLSAVLIEPGFLDATGRATWESESSNYMSGPRCIWQAITAGFRAQHVSGPGASVPDDFLISHMVGVFTNHPENPYHCEGGCTAPNWRFGALSSIIWDGAPAAEVDRLGSSAAEFRGPVLLVAGECNDCLEPLQGQHLSRSANAELVTIQGAGHDVVWDNPDATLAAIRGFLSR